MDDDFNLKKINIVYLDDEPDLPLANYLKNEYRSAEDNIEFNSIEYRKGDTYKKLFENHVFKKADILVIDNRLYSQGDDTPLNGIDLKAIIRLVYPFKFIIIITQNESDIHITANSILKYSEGNERNIEGKKTIYKYYDKNLKPLLEKGMEQIKDDMNLIRRAKKSNLFDKVLTDDMISVFNGEQPIYAKLSKSDIDVLVESIKSFQGVKGI